LAAEGLGVSVEASWAALRAGVRVGQE
jgi:hypothetical protein